MKVLLFARLAMRTISTYRKSGRLFNCVLLGMLRHFHVAPQHISHETVSSRLKEIRMRFVIVLLTLVFAACSTTPVSKTHSQPPSPGQGLASQEPKPSTDSPMEFLLKSAATDFHVHRPPVVERFRDVRFG